MCQTSIAKSESVNDYRPIVGKFLVCQAVPTTEGVGNLWGVRCKVVNCNGKVQGEGTTWWHPCRTCRLNYTTKLKTDAGMVFDLRTKGCVHLRHIVLSQSVTLPTLTYFCNIVECAHTVFATFVVGLLLRNYVLILVTGTLLMLWCRKWWQYTKNCKFMIFE